MKFVDTNILLRFLVDDPEAERIERLLKSDEKIYLSDVVVAEVVWVLKSFYKWNKAKIVDLLQRLLEVKSIKSNRQVIARSLVIYKEHKIKYADAYIVSAMNKAGIEAIYSYDREFNKIKGIHRLEPK